MRHDKPSIFALHLLANHFPALHGLRVLAIISVVQLHLSAELYLNRIARTITPIYLFSQNVWFGMDLFFILSGFLIGNILLGSLEALERGSIGRFYVRRSFRILPLYYVVLTLFAIVLPTTKFQRAELWREYLYLTNYASGEVGKTVMYWGWSLCVEEHFYLAVPLFFLLLRKIRTHRARLWFLGVIWASCLFVRLGIYYAGEPWTVPGFFRYIYAPTHTRYDILVAGIFLAYVHKHFARESKALFARAWVRKLAFAIPLAIFAFIAVPIPAPKPLLWSTVFLGTATSIAYVSLILLTLHGIPENGRTARFLGSTPFLKVATLGYGVYLIHIPIIVHVVIPMIRHFVRQGVSIGLLWPLALATVLALSLAGSYVLHVLVEKPALYLRDRLS